MNEVMFGLKRIDFHYCERRKCPYLKNTVKHPDYYYIGRYYCGLSLKQQLEMCPRVTKMVREKTGCKIKLEPVEKQRRVKQWLKSIIQVKLMEKN